MLNIGKKQTLDWAPSIVRLIAVSNQHAASTLNVDPHTSNSARVARARSQSSTTMKDESYSKGPSISSEAMVPGLVAGMGSVRHPGCYDNIGPNVV
jgi:hypothetical protein